MWRLILLSFIQSIMLTSGQVFLKFALAKMPTFGWTSKFFYGVLTNWQFAMSGLLFGSASLLWMYIVKHYPLSMAFPLISLSYVFGLIAAMVFFHESVGLTKWVGVFLIVAGCVLIAKQ